MSLKLLIELFITFFKIGLFTFGGGYAMIPLITEEVVTKNWLIPEQLLDFIAISESTPGPFAINIATFIGYNQQGILGSIFSTAGVILPSFIIILIIAKAFHRFASNKYVIGFLKGVKPIVVGVIFSVAITFLLKSIFHISIFDIKDIEFEWSTLLIFLVVIVMTRIWKKIHPVFIVLVSGILGLIIYGLIL
ncbi:MAG: chromate transporter [Candidatus Izemoplasmatales bacterium]|jgi:chromate transporter